MGSADEKEMRPLRRSSAAGLMTHPGCWEVGSRERRVHLTFRQYARTGAALEASLLAVSFRAFSLLDWLLGFHSWCLALHSGLGLVRFIGSGNQV